MGEEEDAGRIMTLTERQVLHTSRMGKLICFAGAKGVSVKVQEWNRDLETQKRYVAEGVSKTLKSDHLDKCATDVYVIVNGEPTENDEDYRILGEYWISLGGQWGGRFVNRAEFLKKNGREFDPAKDLGWDVYHMGSPAV